ncbi:hypothetical protein ABK040_004879 [Willaertia magna]
MNSGKSLCFTEDLNPNTPVLITYTPAQQVTKSSLVVKDPFGVTVVDEKNIQYSPNGFRSHFNTNLGVAGIYEICISIISANSYGPHLNKFELEIDRDHHENNLPESKERVDQLNNLLSRVNTALDSIRGEQYYLKDREERFRQTTDSTYDRCFYLGLFKLLFLIGISIWQLTNLRSFFKKKKLI